MGQIETHSVLEKDRVVAPSPAFMKLADSILSDLDRSTVRELLANYLYFRSRERSDAAYARFLLANNFDLILKIFVNSLPALLSACFSDRQLRAFVRDVLRWNKRCAPGETPVLSGHSF
jgi:hypothetical protein